MCCVEFDIDPPDKLHSPSLPCQLLLSYAARAERYQGVPSEPSPHNTQLFHSISTEFMADPQERTGSEALKDEINTELKDWDGDCLLEIMRPLKEDSSLLNERRAAVLHLDTDPEERTGRNSLKDKLDAELKDLAGDCIKVMRLLKDDSSLLKDRALAVLHLGVSRGCIEIVEQVVKFCRGEDNLGGRSDKDKQSVEFSTDEGISASSGNEDASTGAPDKFHTKADSKIENSGADSFHSEDDAIRVAPDNCTSSHLLSLTNDLALLDSEADEIQARPVLDFDELLRAKYLYSGPARELDARAVALVNGNLDVLALLLTKTPSASRIGPKTRSVSMIDLHRDQLRKITEGVVERIKGDSRSLRVCQSIFDAWRNDREFNFLFWDFDLWKERVPEYLFHFLFSIRRQGDRWDPSREAREAELILKCLWGQVWEYQTPPGEDPLWQSLLKLHDAQGRTPFHVAVDTRSVHAFEELCCNFPLSDQIRVFEFAMKLPDGLGRTVWHRQIVLGYRGTGLMNMHGRLASACYKQEIDHLYFSNLTRDAYYRTLWQQPMEDPVICLQRRGIDVDLDSNDVSGENGFGSVREIDLTTPLHSAIMHESQFLHFRGDSFSPQDTPFHLSIYGTGWRIHRTADTLELATLRGQVNTVKRILYSAEQGLQKRRQNSEGGRNSKYGWLGLWKQLQYPDRGKSSQYGWLAGEWPHEEDSDRVTWPTIHIAASSGNYELLKAFIESKICDPYIEDSSKCTVIHAVLDPRDFKIEGHLLDFVNVKYIRPNYLGPPTYESTIVERQGCINLLLQCGCDIFKVDKYGQAPYPKGSLSTHKDFLSWWYDRQLKEFSASQNAMSFATNAISVMATLVATASYVGPLQPPLGYSSGDGPNQIQAKYIWVRIFIVCDTLSFYLAIAAITFSLIPALPMTQQPMAAELEKTRGMIILAVATLFPSIVCILLAFAAGSVVVISANGISSLGGDLTIITASIGGAICLIGFLLLFIRLLGIVFPRTQWVRKIYDVTSVLLQRGFTFARVTRKIRRVRRKIHLNTAFG